MMARSRWERCRAGKSCSDTSCRTTTCGSDLRWCRTLCDLLYTDYGSRVFSAGGQVVRDVQESRMNQKFQAAVHQRDDVVYVKLSGVIDEDNELQELTEKIPAGTTVIDLSEIERINSCGVRDWV